jgi:lipopolysaccharide/colanic/teichoic acid biosynthesis glycosyltransferase
MTPLVASVVRRGLDLAAATAGLVVTAPVLGVAAGLVRATTGSPVVFRQRRLGRYGRPFTLYKLRTMRDPAPGEEGPEHDAERITPVGRWLRATSLDELPSLVNLLRGDITLVGPRPLPVSYWTRFRDGEYRRFDVKPGITGLAQISGRNQLDWPERLALDVEYVATRSLVGDLVILARTIPTVLRRHGVDHAPGVTMHELPAERTVPA